MRTLLVAFGGLAWLGMIGATPTHAQTHRLEVSTAVMQPPRFAGAAARHAPLPLDAVQEPRRLPVLDDHGRAIPFDEIQSRVEGGTTGLLIGGAVGLVLGAVVAVAARGLIGCGEAEGLFGTYEVCSPQETALRDTLGGTAIAAGIVLGMRVGWDTDAVTWQESVDRIRAERSGGTGR